jgi:hypothetical protein
MQLFVLKQFIKYGGTSFLLGDVSMKIIRRLKSEIKPTDIVMEGKVFKCEI